MDLTFPRKCKHVAGTIAQSASLPDEFGKLCRNRDCGETETATSGHLLGLDLQVLPAPSLGRDPPIAFVKRSHTNSVLTSRQRSTLRAKFIRTFVRANMSGCVAVQLMMVLPTQLSYRSALHTLLTRLFRTNQGATVITKHYQVHIAFGLFKLAYEIQAGFYRPSAVSLSVILSRPIKVYRLLCLCVLGQLEMRLQQGRSMGIPRSRIRDRA